MVDVLYYIIQVPGCTRVCWDVGIGNVEFIEEVVESEIVGNVEFIEEVVESEIVEKKKLWKK